ncbi:MAG: TGS domain-containing protein, partial [Candidatus Diapherotrites archaeon]
FLSSLKTDFLEGQIKVFGSNGEKLSLPKGSTPVDFAFRLFPEKAPFLSDAEINGRQKPLWHALQGGDRVILSFSENKTIGMEWLDFAKTYNAREKIRHWLKAGGGKCEKAMVARYFFSATPRKGLVGEIFSSIGKCNACVESFHIEKISPARFEGSLTLSLKGKNTAEKLGKCLQKIKGLGELRQAD